MSRKDFLLPEFITFIEDLGVGEEEREILFEKLLKCNQEWVLLSTLDILSSIDRQDLDHLIQINAPEGVVKKFLEGRMPNCEEIMKQGLIDFQKGLLKEIKNTRIFLAQLTEKKVSQIEKQQVDEEKDITSLQSRLEEIEEKLPQLMKEGDWHGAAQLMEESKKIKKEINDISYNS